MSDTLEDISDKPADSGTYYATTAIHYVNAEPHIGHAYENIVVDVVTRFHRLKGDDTFYLTGTDEHGEKVQKAAEAAGLTPQAYTDTISGKFRSTWDALAIDYDDFIRTTEPRHKKVVQDILQRVYDNGDIIFGEYGGLYCVGCERYYTDKEAVDGKCPIHDYELEYRSEENYFFRMEKYRTWLIDYIHDNPELIRPERYKNEVLGILREPIGDLSISRPRSRIEWGIPLPWDENHVTYVWFDALINYYSALVEGDNVKRYWDVVNHFIGKDIVKPHGVFWPTMLKSAGLPIYKHLNVHGWWLTEGGKMSKSKGNVIRPLDLQGKYGNDAFRYYLLRDMVYGQDATFSELSLAERINADLSNDLGNLLNRTLGMLGKYTDGKIPAAPDAVADADLYKASQEVKNAFISLPQKLIKQFDALQFDRALEGILEAVRSVNKYIADTQPWVLAKDESKRAELNLVLNTCAEALRCASIVLSPVIPTKAQELRQQLGIETAELSLASAANWNLIEGDTQTQTGEPLFPSIDLDALKHDLNTEEPPLEHKDEVTIDDFARLEFRVAEVTSCEAHPKADKLLVLTCKVGPEERTIVSGIKQWYSPDEMIGKKVIIVANLKSVKLRGVLSQGMILAAEDSEGNLSVSSLDRDIASGSEVR